MSHIRKLLELLAIADDGYRQHYDAVKSFLKVHATDDDKIRPERVKRTLSPHEATALLGVWRNDNGDIGIRNDVMIRLLIYTGLRCSELVALRWSDINFEDMTITVRHGKGDKERVAADLLVSGWRYAFPPLMDRFFAAVWHDPAQDGEEPVLVFQAWDGFDK